MQLWKTASTDETKKLPMNIEHTTNLQVQDDIYQPSVKTTLPAAIPLLLRV